MLNSIRDVEMWVRSTFGNESMHPRERSLRFIEEAIELVQAIGAVTAGEIKQLVDKKYNKPPGEPEQELGGVMVTLFALCAERGWNPERAYQQEFQRINNPDVIETCRAKQRQKKAEGF